MASKEFASLRDSIVEAAARSRSSGERFDVEAQRAAAQSSPWPIPADCATSALRAGGVPAYWVAASGSSPERRILYLHGGGWVAGGFGSHGSHAARLAAATGCAVLFPEFRLAPEHPFPAALEDARSAYHWMRQHGPDGARPASAVFVGGDSGGGGLALALLLALRDRREPLPAAAFAFSAVTDLTCSGGSMQTRAAHDIVINPKIVPEAAALYCGAADPRSPLVSPLFGEPAGLPPLLLQVGDAEVMRSDSTRFAERARAAGVDVELEVWPEMFHSFQLCAPVLPEGREALEHVARFVRRHASRD
jgi:monoterpene epsilon-lactone hydrolase